MVLQVNNFTGFETQGTEETSGTSGTPTYPTTDPRSGVAHLSLDAGEEYDLPWVDGGKTDQGDDYIITFGVKPGDKTPTSNSFFLQVIDSDPSSILILRVETNGDVTVRDVGGSLIRTINDPLSETDYQLWQIHFQYLDSATVEIFIDGVSQGQDTAQDLSAGHSLDSSAALKLLGPTGITSPWLFDDVLIQSGASSAADRFSDFAVKGYQKTDGTSTDQGDPLANGTWALVSETPLNEGTSNDAFYENTGNLTGSMITNSGTRSGPTGDSDVTGTIKAAKYIGRFKRGTGAGKVHEFLIGNSGDGVTGQGDMGLSTGYETRIVLSEAASIVPLSSESFQLGMSKSATAGQDVFCGDMWAMLGYVPDTSGGDITMVAAQGSYALTGQAAITIKDTPLTAAQGSYALTGKDAATSQTKSILAAQGSYALSGQTADTFWDHLISAVQGVYALTGKAAITVKDTPITASQGSYVLSGQAAILLRNHLVSAAQGSYSLTGKDAATRKGSTLVAVQGAYALSGQTSVLLWNHLITAVQGSYSLTGKDAVTVKNTSITAAQGAYTLNGQVASLLWGHLIAAAQGSYSLTGQDAVTFAFPVMTAEQGSYILTGKDAITAKGTFITAAQGSYVLTGQTANLLWNHLINADQGFYSLTGQDAILLRNHLIAAAQGSYGLTGQDAVLTFVAAIIAGTQVYRKGPMSPNALMIKV